MREKGGRKKKEEREKKEGGRWVYGGRGAWVLRRAGFICIRKVKADEEKVKHTHRFKDQISVIQQR